jgi:hypothetical protein
MMLWIRVCFSIRRRSRAHRQNDYSHNEGYIKENYQVFHGWHPRFSVVQSGPHYLLFFWVRYKIYNDYGKEKSGTDFTIIPEKGFLKPEIREEQELSNYLARSFFPIVPDQKSDPNDSHNNDQDITGV